MLNGFVVHYQPLALGEEFAKKIMLKLKRFCCSIYSPSISFAWHNVAVRGVVESSSIKLDSTLDST